jgi:hypothetical protein
MWGVGRGARAHRSAPLGARRPAAGGRGSARQERRDPDMCLKRLIIRDDHARWVDAADNERTARRMALDYQGSEAPRQRRSLPSWQVSLLLPIIEKFNKLPT